MMVVGCKSAIFAGLGPAKREVHNYSNAINLILAIRVGVPGKLPCGPLAYLKSIEVLNWVLYYFVVLKFCTLFEKFALEDESLSLLRYLKKL
jgi:hypothetical protein